jgi:integrase
MILLARRHGLRPLEPTTLRWDRVDLNGGAIHVDPAKGGTPSIHPVRSTELLALRQLRQDYPEDPYLFTSERAGPMTVAAFQRVVRSAGEEGKFFIPGVSAYVATPAGST